MASRQLRVLSDKVDAFFARVQERYPKDMQCGSGCADCCHAELTITAVEAQAVIEHASALPVDVRAALRARATKAATPLAPRCAALADDDRCEIYDARPLVCRSHGVPVRSMDAAADAAEAGATSIGVCPRNFVERPLQTVDASCVLDQQTLSATLLAVDRLAALGEPGARVLLRDVLRHLP